MTHEWSVMVTDLILSALCIGLGYMIRTRTRARAQAAHDVGHAFVVCAAAAFLGGVRHGAGSWLSATLRGELVYLTNLCIMLAGTLLLLGVIHGTCRNSEHREAYRRLCWAKLVVLCVLMFISGEAHWVTKSCGADAILITIEGIRALQLWWLRDAGSWLIIGGAMSILAGLLQWGWLVGTSSTLHDNLFHVILMPAMVSYYRAALLFPTWK